VLKFYLDNGSWYAVRPSGTEPKIKIYLYTKADTSTNADKNLQIMENEIMSTLNSIN
jgi:phosphoglucomutase